MKKYLLILLAASFALNAGFFKLWRGERSEKLRYKANQGVLLDSIDYYKSENGELVASVEVLTLTNKELEEIAWVKQGVIDNLNLKAKRLESVSKTETKTEVEVKTVVKDSIIYMDSQPYEVNCLEFKDPFIELSGCIIEDNFEGKIKSYDTLIQAVYRVPKKFLFIRYGTKAIRQEILSKNPYTEIVYTEYIELKKRRR